MTIVTYLPSVLAPARHMELTLTAALDKIKNGDFSGAISRVSSLSGEDYKKAKVQLPSFLFNGTFNTDQSAKNESFKKSSGIAVIDIDKLTPDELLQTRAKLELLTFTAFCFISPSGAGLKVGVRVDADSIHNDSDFKVVFAGIEQYYLGLGIKIDTSGKDVRRACFVSYDPQLYFNPDAEVFVFEPVPVPMPKISTTNTDTCLKRIAKIIDNASDGDRHEARLRASNLAGGYIAGGLLDEQLAVDVLMQLSDTIAVQGSTPSGEVQTLLDGIEHGKLTPIRDINHVEDDEAAEYEEEAREDIDYIVPFPGLIRDIQLWVLERSPRPQPALALMSALIVASTAFGRNFKTECGIKSNLPMIGIVPSGMGKDWPMKAAQEILSRFGLQDSISGTMASGAALCEAIELNSILTLFIDEFGHYYNSITSERASSFSREVGVMITSLYTSANSLTPPLKSTKGKPGAQIDRPHLSIFGVTTEGQFLEPLTNVGINDGSLARYFVFFGKDFVHTNEDFIHDRVLPDSIVNGLSSILNNVDERNINGLNEWVIKFTPEYKAQVSRITKEMDERIIANKDFGAIYARNLVKIIQLTLLIDRKCNIEVLLWCEKIVLSQCKMFIDRFKNSSSVNDNEKYIKLIENKIKQSGKKGISSSELLRCTRQIPTVARKGFLQDLIDSNMVFSEKKNLAKSAKPTTFYFWKK